MGFKRVGDAVVFCAGAGAPCNVLGADRRDVGEEVTHRFPTSPWCVELDAALAACAAPRGRVVVDVSGFGSLVVEDIRFLVRLSRQVSQGGGRLTLLVSPRASQAISALGLEGVLPVHLSLEEALRA
jgi:hypothetical protein